MNWNAINSLSTLGLFVLGLIAFIKPNIDKNLMFTIYILFLILSLIIIYHKLFRLIRKQNNDRVYLVKWGVKHWVENPTTLNRLGYDFDDVEYVSSFEFDLHPKGKSINLAGGQ